MSNPRVGVQLYSVRNILAQDLRGTLKAVADMGYEGVEFFGDYNYSAEELKSLIDEFGLVCCGWHTGFDAVKGDKLTATIEFNKILGNKYIIIPWYSAKTKEDWLKFAAFLNDLSGKLAEHGMVTGYHNHAHEFDLVEGEQPWDLIFSNTNKDVVMQFDIGNGFSGNAVPVEVLKKYPGVAETVHLKPYSKTLGKDNPHSGFAPVIGDDEVPWTEVFNLCETIGGTKWYIVEYESDAYEPMQAIELCLKNIKKLRG
jgi:sugar phosphate isomerase/epimerase